MTYQGERMPSNGEFTSTLNPIPEAPVSIFSWHHSPGSGSRMITYTGASDCAEPVRLTLSPAISPAGDRIYMVFALQSNVTDATEGEFRFPVFGRYEHNLAYFNQKQIQVRWQAEEDLEMIFISFDRSFMQLYLPLSSGVLKRFSRDIRSNESSLLSHSHLPITPRISAVLHDIVHCTQKGLSRELFMKAKVIELLSLQFEQFEESVTSQDLTGLRLEDMKKMHRVRDLLQDAPDTDLSLKEIAHEVGTNEFNLKKQFKKAFGYTVFGYLHQVKMELSKKLLVEGNLKIAEVADRIGYKHATHFTNAFKKHFGYLPNKIRMLLLMPFYDVELLAMCECVCI